MQQEQLDWIRNVANIPWGEYMSFLLDATPPGLFAQLMQSLPPERQQELREKAPGATREYYRLREHMTSLLNTQPIELVWDIAESLRSPELYALAHSNGILKERLEANRKLAVRLKETEAVQAQWEELAPSLARADTDPAAVSWAVGVLGKNLDHLMEVQHTLLVAAVTSLSDLTAFNQCGAALGRHLAEFDPAHRRRLADRAVRHMTQWDDWTSGSGLPANDTEIVPLIERFAPSLAALEPDSQEALVDAALRRTNQEARDKVIGALGARLTALPETLRSRLVDAALDLYEQWTFTPEEEEHEQDLDEAMAGLGDDLEAEAEAALRGRALVGLGRSVEALTEEQQQAVVTRVIDLPYDVVRAYTMKGFAGELVEFQAGEQQALLNDVMSMQCSGAQRTALEAFVGQAPERADALVREIFDRVNAEAQDNPQLPRVLSEFGAKLNMLSRQQIPAFVNLLLDINQDARNGRLDFALAATDIGPHLHLLTPECRDRLFRNTVEVIRAELEDVQPDPSEKSEMLELVLNSWSNKLNLLSADTRAAFVTYVCGHDDDALICEMVDQLRAADLAVLTTEQRNGLADRTSRIAVAENRSAALARLAGAEPVAISA